MLVYQNVTHKKLHVAKCVRHNTSIGRVRVSVSVTVTPVTGSVHIGYRAGLYPVVAYILSEHEDEYSVFTEFTDNCRLPVYQVDISGNKAYLKGPLLYVRFRQIHCFANTRIIIKMSTNT